MVCGLAAYCHLSALYLHNQIALNARDYLDLCSLNKTEVSQMVGEVVFATNLNDFDRFASRHKRKRQLLR